MRWPRCATTDQPDNRGDYLRIFDEEYAAYLAKEETQFKLREYSYLFPEGIETNQVREGYFVDDTLNEHAIHIKKQFIELMDKKGSRKIQVENGDVKPIQNRECKYVQEAEFKRMLDHLTAHLSKRTIYQFTLDSDAFIAQAIAKRMPSSPGGSSSLPPLLKPVPSPTTRRKKSSPSRTI